MEARRGLRQAYFCMRCTKGFNVPLRRPEWPYPQCPHCRFHHIYWGTWADFMRNYARSAKALLPEEVGEAVTQVLKRNRN